MPLKSRVDQILRSCCALVGARGDARKVENGKGRRRVGVRFERLPARVMLTASPGESGGTGGGELLAEFSPLIAPTPPTVAVGAAAFSSTVTGTSTNLSVLGADNAGEASLTYTWSTTATPGAGVVFSSNGSNAAKDVTATFSLAGNYSFLVTITDGSGGSVTSSVNVTVDQTFTSIAVSPGAGSVYVNQNRHFHATALDQFGTAMALQPTFDWTLASGAGSIAGDGDFTAAGVAGSTVVEAISGSIGGTATITVLDTAPTITDPASAFPGTVTGTTTDLSVNEGDDGGSGNLIYTWSVLSKPSGAISPTFSENGDNNASNSTATFYAAGSYQIQATVMDASGLSATSDVTVVVSQTLTSIAINPSSPTVLTGGTQQLTATGLDQFGAVMASEPTFFWTASGGGSVSSGGLYTAPGSAATATVTAWAEFIHASATMFVVQTPAITASPNIVTGTTTTLDASTVGGAAYSYAWTVTSKPAGAATPTFSTNNSLTTSTVVTFSQAGTYTFQVDASFLILFNNTASITITVDQTLTSIAVSPATSSMNPDAGQNFSATGYDQFGAAMAVQPSVEWAVSSGGGHFTGGSHHYVAPDSPTNAIVTASVGSVVGSATVTVVNTPPTVASPATDLTSSPTAPGEIILSVLGADDGGEDNLTYTWSLTGTPPGTVEFSSNGVNAAQNVFATLSAAGTYHFLATINDASGLSTTSAVVVTAGANGNQPATISAPGAQQTAENTPLAFSTGGGDLITVANAGNLNESITLSATNGLLTLATTAGLFFSTGNGTGNLTMSFSGTPAQVNAALNGLSFAPTHDFYGTGGLEISANAGFGNAPAIANVPIAISYVNQPPTVATAAAASPNPVSGTTTNLSVQGADDGGIDNLTYVWTVTSKPVGAANPSFSLNGTNSANDTIATFSQAGAYTLLVTITDAGGLSTTSSVNVQVNQTLSSIVVAPADPAVTVNDTQQFSATAFDQFGQSMLVQPAFTWSASSGTINSTGFFTAPASAASVTIGASSGLMNGSTIATVEPLNAAAASPSVVTGTTTTLSVLGPPTTGIYYTWFALTKPAGATFPTYSVNGTTGSQTTVATFFAAGNYTFEVAINNAGAINSETVNVTVLQTLGSMTVSPASVNINENAQSQFSATGFDQFGAAMASEPSFVWTVQSGVGAIDGSGLYTAPGSDHAGTATIAAASGGISGTASVTVTNAAPTVAVAASATPGTVTETSTTLGVLGADDGGESNLTYTWATTGTPPAAVVFSSNGNNIAKNTTATFSVAGAYQFVVTITDAEGLTATSNVNVTVDQAVSTLSISPVSPTIFENSQQQFSATATDQFGNAMATPALSWAVQSGPGSIDSAGLYSGPGVPGSATVSVSGAGVTGTDTITIVNAPPTVAVPAASSANPVTTASTGLSVLGADDGGEPNLTYTWSTTGSIPGSVTFSANNTNASKRVVATFSATGTYNFLVTIVDAQGASTTSSVSVLVVSTYSGIVVSPVNSSLERAASEQFSATAVDQFGAAMASQPGFAWSVVGNVGSIDASGNFTSPTAGIGTATIVATSAGISGMATVNLVDDLFATVPGPQQILPNSRAVFADGNAISISDADPSTAGVPVSLTLTAADGVMTLSGETGLAFASGTGTGDSSMTFSGSLTDIDNALAGMVFTPQAGFNGSASVQLTINELGSLPSPSTTVVIHVNPAAAGGSAAAGSSSGGAASGSSGGGNNSGILGGNSDGGSNSSPPSPPSIPSNSGGDSSGNSGTTPSAPTDSPPPAETPAPAPAPVPPANPAPASPTANGGPVVKAAGAPAAAAAAAENNDKAAATTDRPTLTVIPSVRVETVPEQVFPFLAQQSPMWKNMDTVKDQMASEKKLKVEAGSATVASLGASAAYFLWILRGGSLLSSLLSIFPAWKSMDPLPVLESFESERKRRKRRGAAESESLESLVDKSNSSGETIKPTGGENSN